MLEGYESEGVARFKKTIHTLPFPKKNINMKRNGPDELLAMKMQRMLLVVAKHLKHNGFILDVLDEGLGDLH